MARARKKTVKEVKKAVAEVKVKREMKVTKAEEKKLPKKEVYFCRMKVYDPIRYPFQRWMRSGAVIFRGSDLLTGALPKWYKIPKWFYEEELKNKKIGTGAYVDQFFDFAFTVEEVLRKQNQSLELRDKDPVDVNSLDVGFFDQTRMKRQRKMGDSIEGSKFLADLME